jgi:hypothetical protein
MKKLALAWAVTLMACTQAQAPSAEAPAGDAKTQTMPSTQTVGGSAAAVAPTATTPILSLLIGTSITPAAKGMWCLKEGTAPFTKISAQDESIAAPIENQSAPLPNTSVAKDTATQQAPGTARITSQSGDSTFQIQWLSKGIKGDARIMVQGDNLTFSDDAGTATFQRCQ